MVQRRVRKVSRGSEELRSRLTERGAIADLAKKLGKGPELVSRWASGWRLPSPVDRAVLLEMFGIDWRWWDEPPVDKAGEEAPGEPGPTFQDSSSSTGTHGGG